MSLSAPRPSRLLGLLPWLLTAILVVACARTDSADDDAAGAETAERIVSLMPTCTETLIELGAADRIVGIGRFDPEVPGRADLPRLGDATTVSAEAIAARSPDLVLVNSLAMRDALASLPATIQVKVVASDSLEQVFTAVEELAALTGTQDRGGEILAGFESALAAARERATTRASDEAPKVVFVAQRRPYYVAGAGSYVNELLVLIGAQNAFADVADPWPMVSEEALLARGPTVVLDASLGDRQGGQSAEELLATWTRFSSLPAVNSGRVHAVSGEALFRPGPRLPEAILQLEQLVFGEDERR